MSVFARFKKSPDGLKNLVELWETTPLLRRQKMIEIGKSEDPAYTDLALKYVILFEDILKLSDDELKALLQDTPPRLAAYAIFSASEDVKTRWLEVANPPVRREIQEYLGTSQVPPTSIGGAQLKMVEITRKLVKKGEIHCKKVPVTN